MGEENRFELLLSPEIGDGVNTHSQKFIKSSPDNLELIVKHVPHTETAVELLLDGHGDIVPVSGEWWYNNRIRELSPALVLPRREPNRVLVGNDKPEYIPKNGIIVADCEIIRRQMLRSRNDIQVKLADQYPDAPNDIFERVKWLEILREKAQIDGFTTTRTLHSSLESKPRRHTLGMQRQDDVRSRFIPKPLEGYTILLTRKDFPASRFSKVIDAGAALALRLEITVLDSIEKRMRNKIGLIIEQRKVRSILQDVGNRGKSLGSEKPLKEWKTFSGADSHQGPKDSDSRIDVILETINIEGTVTTSVERIFPVEESHSGIQNLVVNWQQLLKIAREKPEEEKRGRMKQLMDDYIDDLVEGGRISEGRIYSPMFDESDHD